MNRLEKFIYDKVKSNPRLKLFLRNIYQKAFDLLPRQKSWSELNIINREGYFFGFHDHSPFSADNKKLLGCKYLVPLRMPNPEDELEIGYFYGEEFESYKPVSRTRAWMWHMGCKLQWRGKSSSEILFNDYSDGKHIARLVDVNDFSERRFEAPIGSVSPDGNWAVGYSFARVARCMPGYGYHHEVNDLESEEEAPETNGIHRINLVTGQCELLLTLSQLAEFEPEKSMEGCMHFVSHTVFSPSSKRFLFLHRWVQPDGDIDKRWTRLISCDLDGRNIFVFPTTDMVSHVTWKDSENVIAYCRVKDLDDQYVLFKDQSKSDYSVIGLNLFNSDGHPSFDSSGRWMITDTYPNRRRMQRLVLFDLYNNKKYTLANLFMPKKFQSPNAYNHWACDLHPRWDRKSEYVCFDATYSGKRSLCTIRIDKFLSQLSGKE